MDEHLSVSVPRNLRVSTTVAKTIADTTIRLRLPVFLCVSSAGIAALLALLWGNIDLAALLLVGGVIGAVLLEVRLWGYSTVAVCHMLLAYLRQPGQLQLQPILLTLPPEDTPVAVVRRPRWDAQHFRHEEGVR